MAILNWGKTLIIANPAAHSGDGMAAVDVVDRILSEDGRRTTRLEILLTKGPGDGRRLAAEAAGYDTVIALGGDGVIHEVANGLMHIEQEQRPRLGIIPVGTGNDYARTLGIPFDGPEAALQSLLSGQERALDVGLCNDEYFVETLSFGLDAAIALDTSSRRAAGSSMKGAKLFATSGMKIFSTHHDGWEFKALFDGAEGISGREIIFAVQVGPTYGGGFKVCPKADPTDGLLDVCYNALIPNTPTTLVLFGMARFGLHVGAKSIRTRTAERIRLSFPTPPPCQVDGERLEGSVFEVSCVPGALRVIVPKTAKL